jgi:hypothetical protein
MMGKNTSCLVSVPVIDVLRQQERKHNFQKVHSSEGQNKYKIFIILITVLTEVPNLISQRKQ